MNHDPDPPKSCIFTRFVCDFAKCLPNFKRVFNPEGSGSLEKKIREDQDLSKRTSGRIRIFVQSDPGGSGHLEYIRIFGDSENPDTCLSLDDHDVIANNT